MQSCLYEGQIRHRRFTPRPHTFQYDCLFACLDLSELGEVFQHRWFWSTGEAAWVWFRREDHLGPVHEPLAESVANLVERRTGCRPGGPIRLLTQLRYAGFAFNPLSVYFCYDSAGRDVEVIIADVSNTPWLQRHAYVLGRPGQPLARCTDFDKQFHVSPFMPMDQFYRWRFRGPGERLVIQMENFARSQTEADQPVRPVFDATLTLRRREINTRTLRSALVRYPLMSVKTVAGIYWQAARLWWKGIPYHPHPDALPPVE